MPRQARPKGPEPKTATARETTLIYFLDFTADLGSGELFRRGEKVAIQERPFQILSLLLQRPNEVVSRHEICREVWKRASAQADASLNTAIRKLRSALGDDARDPTIIKTAGKRGYQLVVNTRTAAEEGRPARILVRRFEDRSVGVSDRFAEWMTEQMIVQLADPRSELQVIVPVELQSEAGRRDARADYVLSGVIIRANGNVRLNATLSRGPGETRVWSRSYRRKLDDVVRAQDEITLQIACDILQTLPRTAARRPSPEAQGKTEKGQHFAEKWNELAFERAVAFFEQAIAEDTAFARAHAALARTRACMLQYGVHPPAENHAQILIHAGRALELCPNLPEALVAIGCAQFFYDADWTGAEKSFQHALNVNPASAYAYEAYARLLLTVGRHEEAIETATRARELDTLSPYAHTVVGAAFYFSRRYAEAMEALKECVEMEPCFSMARAMLARCYEGLGDWEQSVKTYRSAVECAPKSTVMLANLAHGLAVAGQMDESRTMTERLLRMCEEVYVPPYWLAMCHVGLGEFESGIEWLRTAVQEHCGWRVLAGVDPKLDVIREREDFKSVLGSIFSSASTA